MQVWKFQVCEILIVWTCLFNFKEAATLPYYQKRHWYTFYMVFFLQRTAFSLVKRRLAISSHGCSFVCLLFVRHHAENGWLPPRDHIQVKPFSFPIAGTILDPLPHTKKKKNWHFFRKKLGHLGLLKYSHWAMFCIHVEDPAWFAIHVIPFRLLLVLVSPKHCLKLP